MKKVSRRALSLVLSFLMTLSFALYDYPIMSYSAEKINHIWTKVNLSEISENDSIAIAVTEGDNTYVLPNAQSTNAVPNAVLATVKNGELTIPEGIDSDYAWKITKKEVKHDEAKGAESSQKEASTEGASKEEPKTEGASSTASTEGAASAASTEEAAATEESSISSVKESAETEGASAKEETVVEPDAPKNGPSTESTKAVEYYYVISANGNDLYNIDADNVVRVAGKSGDEAGAKWNVESGCISVKNLVFYKLTDKVAGGDISAPKASVDSDKAVDYGTEIKLSCDVEDIDIYYNTNDTANYSKYTKPIKITKDMTIHAYASKDGKESEKVSFKYTLKSGTKITDTDGIRDGLEFVLVNQGSAALSYQTSGKNNEKLSSTAVEVGGDNLLICKAKDSKLAKLKLEENKDQEKQFYITTEYAGSDSSNKEKYYLVSGATGNKLNFVKDTGSRDKLGLWTFATKENGDFLIKNVNAAYNNNAQYIEIYSNDYTTYSYSDKNKTKFLFSVYTTPEVGEEGEKKKLRILKVIRALSL